MSDKSRENIGSFRFNDITLPISNPDQVVMDPTAEIIYALIKEEGEHLPSKLLMFDEKGAYIGEVPPPPGYGFYYMECVHHKVQFICSSDNPDDERQDWRFERRRTDNRLIRICPSY